MRSVLPSSRRIQRLDSYWCQWIKREIEPSTCMHPSWLTQDGGGIDSLWCCLPPHGSPVPSMRSTPRRNARYAARDPRTPGVSICRKTRGYQDVHLRPGFLRKVQVLRWVRMPGPFPRGGGLCLLVLAFPWYRVVAFLMRLSVSQPALLSVPSGHWGDRLGAGHPHVPHATVLNTPIPVAQIRRVDGCLNSVMPERPPAQAIQWRVPGWSL